MWSAFIHWFPMMGLWSKAMASHRIERLSMVCNWLGCGFCLINSCYLFEKAARVMTENTTVSFKQWKCSQTFTKIFWGLLRIVKNVARFIQTSGVDFLTFCVMWHCWLSRVTPTNCTVRWLRGRQLQYRFVTGPRSWEFYIFGCYAGEQMTMCAITVNYIS